MDFDTAHKTVSKRVTDAAQPRSGAASGLSGISSTMQPGLKLRSKPRIPPISSAETATSPAAPASETASATRPRAARTRSSFYVVPAFLVLVEIALFAAIQHYSLSPWFYAPVTAIGCIAFAIWAIEHFATPNEKPADASEGDQRARLLAERLEALEDQSWEIRESEEIHRSLAEAFGDVVLHRTQAGAITFSNGPYQRYFSSRAVLPGPHVPSAHRGASSDVPQKRDIQLNTLVGPRWFSWMDIITRDPATGEMGIRSVARDITDRKTNERAMMQALERAKIASDAKSRFLAMVSHEIRTPLNGVLGMAQLLEDTKLDPTQGNYVDAIHTSGKALLSLIEDLLDSARIEAGQFALQPQRTELRSLVENVAEILAPRAGDKSVAIASHIGPSVPRYLNIDAGRLRQVLLNLAGNAMKFTETGGVGIFVRVEKPGLLTFTIADTGPGLSQEDQQKVFTEFVQTDAGATRSHGGAGLGLSISSNIVSLMGGDITIRSELGAGAEFSFDIAVQETIPRDPIPKPLASRRIALVMETSPAAVALGKTLQSLGAEVENFPNLEQLMRGKHAEFSSVIIDVGQSGGQTADYPAWFGGKTRMIALAHVKHSDHLTGLGKNGFDGWLTFPVRSETLTRVMLETRKPTHVGGTARSERSEVREDTSFSAQPSMNILLAEDNPVNALLAKSLLAKLGHRVVHVTDGQTACRAFGQATQDNEAFDIVLMDLQMPIMDGRAAIEVIRKFERRLSTPATPVIVLTADGQEEVRDEVMAGGADGLLTKPLDLEVVARLINAYAQQKVQPA